MEPDRHDDPDGQVAFVTDASRGIGRQIAANLCDRGATVYAGSCSVTNETPEETERVLPGVTQEGDIEEIVDGIFVDQNRLDVLTNGAGAGGEGEGIVTELTERIDRTLGVNLHGPMLLCKYVAPPLLQFDGGRVVNVSSGMGALDEEQFGGSPAYRISKIGLSGLTTYLDDQYGSNGLIANSVRPGWAHIGMGGGKANRPVEKGAETPTWLATFKSGAPAGKFRRGKEVIDW